jgi:hypothetical protein
MGKMGDTWRWVETITTTGETDQGVTVKYLDITSVLLFKVLLGIQRRKYVNMMFLNSRM